MGKGIGGHTLPNQGRSDDWLTPPEVIQALGPFDFDPCASSEQPWRTAQVQIAPPKDGLQTMWPSDMFVWCNPPYGRETWEWLDRLDGHNHGIALIFARTETKGFFEQVWAKASALLFIEGRLFFHHPVTGERAAHNSGGPSVLVAYGEEGSRRLYQAQDTGTIRGAYIDLWTFKQR